MNANMTGLRWFSKVFASLTALDESCLITIGRVKMFVAKYLSWKIIIL